MIGKVNSTRVGDQQLPPLPAPMVHVNPHIYVNVGRENDPAEDMSTLEFLFDTGIQTNTAKIENIVPYIRHKLHHNKASYDAADGVYAPILP